MPAGTSLPDILATALRRETAGEPVRWSGRPHAMTAFLRTTPVWLMGVPWTAFSSTMLGVLLLAVTSGKPPLATVPAWQIAVMGAALLFVGSFVLLGLAMLAAPFYAAWQAARTVHAITDRRLVSITCGRETVIKSTPARDLRRIERRERRDGSGTLRVVTSVGRDSDGDPVETIEDLIGIADVARAARLLEGLRSDNRAHPRDGDQPPTAL